jgi:hypothetical protein
VDLTVVEHRSARFAQRVVQLQADVAKNADLLASPDGDHIAVNLRVSSRPGLVDGLKLSSRPAAGNAEATFRRPVRATPSSWFPVDVAVCVLRSSVEASPEL